jgi:hypothetical protein
VVGELRFFFFFFRGVDSTLSAATATEAGTLSLSLSIPPSPLTPYTPLSPTYTLTGAAGYDTPPSSACPLSEEEGEGEGEAKEREGEKEGASLVADPFQLQLQRQRQHPVQQPHLAGGTGEDTLPDARAHHLRQQEQQQASTPPPQPPLRHILSDSHLNQQSESKDLACRPVNPKHVSQPAAPRRGVPSLVVGEIGGSGGGEDAPAPSQPSSLSSAKSVKMGKRRRLASFISRFGGGGGGGMMESMPMPFVESGTATPLETSSSSSVPPTPLEGETAHVVLPAQDPSPSPSSFLPTPVMANGEAGRSSASLASLGRNKKPKRVGEGGKRLTLFGTSSSAGGDGERRRKLIVSGLGVADEVGCEAVRRWCEVRRLQQHCL